MAICGIGLYLKNSPAAVALYCDAFGLELGYHVLNDDGTFFHSELCKNGEEALSVVEAATEPCEAHSVQLGMIFENREEFDHAFALLSENGRVLMDVCELPWSPCAADVVDCFGIRWYLSLPQYRPSDDFSPHDMEN